MAAPRAEPLVATEPARREEGLGMGGGYTEGAMRRGTPLGGEGMAYREGEREVERESEREIERQEARRRAEGGMLRGEGVGMGVGERAAFREGHGEGPIQRVVHAAEQTLEGLRPSAAAPRAAVPRATEFEREGAAGAVGAGVGGGLGVERSVGAAVPASRVAESPVGAEEVGGS